MDGKYDIVYPTRLHQQEEEEEGESKREGWSQHGADRQIKFSAYPRDHG